MEDLSFQHRVRGRAGGSRQNAIVGVVAALNVVYLKQRDARVTVPHARRALMETAQAVSRSLGWTRAA